jgi:hypothetical protein
MSIPDFAPAADAAGTDPRAALFADRRFTWYALGSFISILGDQFTLIAMPWLVLRLTGDSVTLGLVLALMSLPRAAFILIGGAIVDRYSPRSVLMNTKYVNLALLGTFAGIILCGRVELWMMYGFALALGLSTAFSIPSATAILPQIVASHQLGLANSIIMSQRQLCLLAGPLLAGLLIVVCGDGGDGAAHQTSGLGLAFLLDALSYLASAWTLSRVRLPSDIRLPVQAPGKVLAEVAEGVRHFWRDAQLRTLCLYYGAICFCIAGPMQVLTPVLADSRFGHRAEYIGAVLGAHGAGTLLGMLAAGMTSNLRFRSLGMTILLLDGVGVLLFAPMICMDRAWQGVLVLLLVGALSGFVQIAVFTWMQRRVPPAMLGRAMGLFMFIFVGIAPVSAAITGLLLRHAGVNAILAGSGLALALIVLGGLASPGMRSIVDAPRRF